jgi:selenocysteine lyase/cysteine desulfurase
MPEPVLRAVQDHLDLEARIGGYEAAAARGDAIEGTYTAMAELLGAEAGQVAFTDSATTSFSTALSAVPFKPGDVLVTTRDDYASNQIMYLALKARLGIEVVRAPDTPEGGVDVLQMAEIIHRRRPRLVAVTHIPTNSGLVQPVAAIGRECRDRDILYLVDACQSVGQLPLDMEAIGCDFLTGTSRKFVRGPRGMGFLALSQKVLDRGLEPLFIDMRGADWVDDDMYQPAFDAQRFESWEFSYANLLGIGEAARYALTLGVDRTWARARALARHARQRLASLPGARVLDRGEELCAIVTVAIEGRDPPEIVHALREKGINTSALDRASGVIDFDEKGVEGALRVSPHYYNTEDEIEALVEALGALA